MLNKRQQDFAEYYIQCGNATEAALKAGYSPKTARVIGSENLTKPDISSYIEDRLTYDKTKKIATSDEVVAFFTSVMRGEEMAGCIPCIRDRMMAGRELLKRFDAAATEPGLVKTEDDPLSMALREEAERLDHGTE